MGGRYADRKHEDDHAERPKNIMGAEDASTAAMSPSAIFLCSG